MQSNVATKLYHNFNFKQDLFKFLLERLPKQALYGFSKKDLTLKREAPAREAILKGKFLYYNQNLITELIFDIDNIYQLSIYDLDWIYKVFYEKFGLTITWSCKTDRGVQFCISLNTFYKLSKKQKKVIKEFKEHIIDNFPLIERAGSIRLKGWWRNPLKQNEFRYYGNILTFGEILDFLRINKLSIKQQFKTATIKNTLKANKQAIKEKKFFLQGEPEEGNRNVWLWYNTMLYCNSKNFDKVLEVVKELNKKCKPPLEKEEVKKIARSVTQYNKNNQNKIYGWNVKANWNIGAMKFEKIKNLSKKEYEKEVKRRQKMAGKVIGKGNIEKYVRKKAEDTREKVYKAIQELKEKGEKVTVRKVKELAQVSIASAQKYVKQAKKEGLV